jgi:hypothetical protein
MSIKIAQFFFFKLESKGKNEQVTLSLFLTDALKQLNATFLFGQKKKNSLFAKLQRPKSCLRQCVSS